MDAVDVAIIGAGPVGCATALAWAQQASPHRLRLLDASAPDQPAIDRTLALSHGSCLLLSRLGVWQRLQGEDTPFPIKDIVVNQQAGPGYSLIRASESGVPALGYTLRYAALKTAFAAALLEAGVHLQQHTAVQGFTADPASAILRLQQNGQNKTLSAGLVILADGGGAVSLPGSRVSISDPSQTAVLCQIQSSKATHNKAYERFTPNGPLALLPTGSNRYGVVWTHAASAAQARQQQAIEDPEVFLSALQQALNEPLGQLSLLTPVKLHPLTLRSITPRVSHRAVAIGNAAQALHPIAGQGLNLGLRDASDLANQLARLPVTDLGHLSTLHRYASSRALDRHSGIGITQGLLAVFGLPAWANIPRGLGISVFDAIAPLKHAVARKMMGL